MFRFGIQIFVIILLTVSVMLGQGINRYDRVNPDQKITETALNQPTFSIYPNPATAYFSIQGNDRVTFVEVYNLAGKLIIRWESNESNHYQIQELKNGLYLVRLLDKNKKVLKVNRINKE